MNQDNMIQKEEYEVPALVPVLLTQGIMKASNETPDDEF